MAAVVTEFLRFSAEGERTFAFYSGEDRVQWMGSTDGLDFCLGVGLIVHHLGEVKIAVVHLGDSHRRGRDRTWARRHGTETKNSSRRRQKSIGRRDEGAANIT